MDENSDEDDFIPEIDEEKAARKNALKNAEGDASKAGGEASEFFEKQKKMAEKKDLKVVDHSQISYGSFRKAFYIEVKEIADMTEEQVAKYR